MVAAADSGAINSRYMDELGIKVDKGEREAALDRPVRKPCQ